MSRRFDVLDHFLYFDFLKLLLLFMRLPAINLIMHVSFLPALSFHPCFLVP
jgi:hypothetical protein